MDNNQTTINVNNFFTAVTNYAEYVTSGNSKMANKYHSVMQKTFNRLKEDDQRKYIFSRINDNNPFVSVCVSSFCIKLEPEKCITKLKEIQKYNSPASLIPEIIIDLYEKGKF